MDFTNNNNNNFSSDNFCDIFYKYVLENTVDCIWVFDLKNECYKYISPAVYRLRGLTVEEAMKESLEDSLTLESIQKIKDLKQKRYSRFLSGERSEEIIYDVSEYTQYCADGSTIIVEISTRLFWNEETQGVEIIGVSRDISERKQYENDLIVKLRNKTKLLEKANLDQTKFSTIPKIYFFPRFMVFGANHTEPLTWRTHKTEELFAFLLNLDTPKVSRDEVIENLWPNTIADKAIAYLHNTLYNLKKDLHSVGINIQIKFSNGYYSYTLPAYYSDIFEFTTIMNDTISPFDCADDQSAANYERALSLYQDGYLSYNGYLWSLTKSATLREQFESLALSLSRYYILKHNYKATKRILNKLLNNDNLNELFHELLLKVYLQEKNYSAFLAHYSKLEELLLKEFDTQAKHSIQALYNDYRQIIEADLNVSNSHF